jgi:hypothetical protein
MVEVQQGVVPMKPAEELPHLFGRPGDYAVVGDRCGLRLMLH